MLVRASLASPLALAASLAAFGLLGGCKEKIGDECAYNVDCSKLGDRLCDLASPGGYCTVENCSADSCPDEAICVAFYPVELLTKPCDPATEDAVDDASATDACTTDELCTRSALCAPKASVRRYCMLECDDGGDCRDGYECRRTGLDGAELVPAIDQPYTDQVARFCAPAR